MVYFNENVAWMQISDRDILAGLTSAYLKQLLGDRDDLAFVKGLSELGKRLVRILEACGNEVDCILAHVALSDLNDVWMIHSAHELTSLQHLTDLQTLFRFGDSLAEARVARLFVHEMTRGHVRVALCFQIEDVVVLLHDILIAPLLEVSISQLEDSIQLPGSVLV